MAAKIEDCRGMRHTKYEREGFKALYSKLGVLCGFALIICIFDGKW